MRALALALLAAAALAAGGCGGDDGEARGLLERGFATDVESGVLALDVELELRGVELVEGPLRLRLEGPFRAAGGPTELPDLDMDFRASGAGMSASGGVVITRDNAWVEFRGETYEVGEELWARFVELAERQGESRPDTLAEAGVDPLDWVEDVEQEGDEEVAGAQTTKLAGRLDVGALLRDLRALARSGGQPLPESAVREAEQALDDVEFEAWIGRDDIWRRISAESEFEVPEDERDAVGGLEGGRVQLHVQLAQPNEPVQIEEPARARPIDELLRRLGIPPELLLGPGFAQPAPG